MPYGGVLIVRKLFMVMILIALGLATSAYVLAPGSNAQGLGNYQSVGGDFGRSWVNNFMAQNQPAPEQNLKKDLWSWGGAPKGSTLIGGKLVPNANKTSTVNVSANWLGDTSMEKPIVLNSTTPYGNYGTTGAPLTPSFLSDDPWVLAQQLGRPVVTVINPGY
jgi:hypothetical protein